MTNSHSIKELQMIEAALHNIALASKNGLDISDMLELIKQKASDVISEVCLTLLQHDFDEAETAGHSISNHQKSLIIFGELALDDVLSLTNSH